MHQNFIRAAAAAAVAATFSSAAVAGGFQLTEQSALGLGRAYAGMGVDGTDVSGLYYNPATMTLHTGTQAQFGFVGVGLNLDYNPKSRSKPSRYSSENDVLIEKSVKYTDFFLLSIVYV